MKDKPKIETLCIGCEKNGIQTIIVNGNKHPYPAAASIEFVISRLSAMYSLTVHDIKEINLMW